MRRTIAAAIFAGLAVIGQAQAAEDIYLGYYREDPATNPEDPTIGALYLALPKGDDRFSGKMFFTYVGCQSSNSGAIEGDKTGASLSGHWSGSVDGHAEQGAFSGSAAAEGIYAGTYTVAAGKQHVDVPNCISYIIAPNGTFELFGSGKAQPAGFAVSVTNAQATWTPAPGAMVTLVFVLDAEKAAGQENAVVWQALVPGAKGQASLAPAKLMAHHRYVLAIASMDGRFQRVAFTSTPFGQP